MSKSVYFEDEGILSKVKGFLNWKTLLVILGVLVIIGLVVYFMRRRSVVYEHFQDGPKASKTAEIMFFYADWCPHCKTAKPEWEQVKTEFQGKSIKGYNVLFKEVNCTEESAENEKLMATYKIQGYPTIKLVKDGQVIDFDAKPTKSTLTQFLNTVI
jgi:thiol-disulfide isomerase/thioredoxin